MQIGKYEFPDSCPLNCAMLKEDFYQGSLCTRCPIFNCKKLTGPNGEKDWSLLRPEDYRLDWAKEWKRWFDRGMTGWPELTLGKEEKNVSNS